VLIWWGLCFFLCFKLKYLIYFKINSIIIKFGYENVYAIDIENRMLVI